MRDFSGKNKKFTDMEEKELTYKDIPMGYALCFNSECTKKDNCMHYQAMLLKQDGRNYGNAVFSGGCGPYYRVNNGDNMISPKQQENIMKIVSQFGSTEGIRFDHYVEEWDFGY